MGTEKTYIHPLFEFIYQLLFDLWCRETGTEHFKRNKNVNVGPQSFRLFYRKPKPVRYDCWHMKKPTQNDCDIKKHCTKQTVKRTSKLISKGCWLLQKPVKTMTNVNNNQQKKVVLWVGVFTTNSNLLFVV